MKKKWILGKKLDSLKKNCTQKSRNWSNFKELTEKRIIPLQAILPGYRE
jgi:hypothetical protein